MIKIVKDNPVNNEGKLYDRYIKLYGFKDEIEQDVIFKKIEQLLKEQRGRVKVF